MPIFKRFGLICCLVVVSLALAAATPAQEKPAAVTDASKLTLDRIFHSSDFSEESLGTVRWLTKSSAYTTREPSQQYKGYHDLVRHDPKTGNKEILAAAAHLIPAGKTAPLSIESFTWSPNEGLVLIFTNSKRVWRHNTRGDYWIYDITSRELHRLGGKAPDSSLMFARFSPDGRLVAYVRERNIYVEDLADHTILQLTQTSSPDIINGTFDWVYEEELDLRDGLRWSPDSSNIAFWQLDTSGVGDYYLVDNIQGLYQGLKKFHYPKAGTTNAAGKIGVIRIERGPAAAATSASSPLWLKIPGDPRNHYIARMDWANNSQEIILQQLNRLQNTNKVMLADVKTGEVKTILTETDPAWVDVHDNPHWIDKGKQFLWLSERSGWRQIYRVSRTGDSVKLVTEEEADVIGIAHVDDRNQWIFYYASPANATQKYLYKIPCAGGTAERVTPSSAPGTHSYDISPDSRWAIHTYSSFTAPPTTNLIRLPEHTEVRSLTDNHKLRDNVQKLQRGPAEFFKVDLADGVQLDAWSMQPPRFDANKKYPVLFHVYGEPAGQTVLDRWNGTTYLWHLFLTQNGYVVMSVDNRGTPAPRGRDWRKIIYRQVGILAPKEQAAAVRAIEKRWPWVDSERIGIWGWSGGGSMSLHAIFRFPDLYRMAMSIAPVANERYYDTIYQERYMGLPKDNVQGYRDGSPITYATQLKGDLLIIHGTADDNVHYANTEALVQELIAANKQFTMMAYPNQSHSIREGRNTRRHLFTLLTNYLREHLPTGAREQ